MEPLPRELAPMLATLGPLPPDGAGWVFEVKWDGIRTIASFDGRTAGSAGRAAELRLRSRRGNDVTATFPDLAPLAEALAGRDVVLDGEIVAFGERDGRQVPDFQTMQQRLGVTGAEAVRRSREVPALLAVFDVLHVDGESTRSLPLTERHAVLEGLLPRTGPCWTISAIHEDGAALHAATRAAGLEGVLAKRASSPYNPGVRTRDWVKVKHLDADELVIGGWVPGEGRREGHIGALLLGQPESDDPGAPLRYCGRVGTGWTDAELARLQSVLAPRRRATSPFSSPVAERRAVFVEPGVVAKVEYREWTAQGLLRAPSYKGLVAVPVGADTPAPSPSPEERP